MKRIITFLLTLVLLVSSATLSSLYVLAASGESGSNEVPLSEHDGSVEGSASFDVTGSYDSSHSPVYKVVITFGDLNFKYKPIGSLTWDAAALTYRNSTHYDWESTKKIVTVVNRSNVDVKVTASVSKEADTEHNVNIEVGPSEKVMAAAEENASALPVYEFSVSVGSEGSGTVDPDVVANSPVKIGQVTFTLERAVAP